MFNRLPESILLALAFSAHGLAVGAETLNLAVAANFRACFEQLTDLYQQETGKRVEASYASSGILYAQIVAGAPFDGFFSADSERVDKVIQQGFAASADRITYAFGRLVLWRPGASEAPDARALAALLADPRQRLAMANPNLAPYGRAARDTLEHLDLWQDHQRQFVVAPSVSQALHYVVSGGVGQGLVAYAQIVALKQRNLSQGVSDAATRHLEQSYWRIPQDLYAPIRQDAVALGKAGLPAARAFVLWVGSRAAQSQIQRCGYEVPGV